MAFYLTLVLNFLIIFSYSVYFGDSNDEYDRRMYNPRLFLDESLTNTIDIFRFIGIVMIFCSSFVVLFFLIKKAPLVVKKAWSLDILGVEKNPDGSRKKLGLLVRLVIFVLKSMYTVITVLKTPEIVYYILYGALAVMGVVIHPFLFSFHLTEVLLRYPTLRSVIKSFWEPRVALVLTLFLFLIFEYIFSLIAFTAFYEDYAGNCQSTIDCFLYTFDNTFKANGGIGGKLADLSEETNPEFDVGRYLFDNAFNIILVIIMINIVAGIIIDRFGSLRESENEKAIDIQERCFICGKERETFERRSEVKEGFEEHIKIDHYMWNYLFFIAYLKNKEETDYTGIESYISDKLNDNNFSWFPLHKAMVLEDIEDEEEKQLEHIRGIKDTIKQTRKVADEMSDAFQQALKKFDTEAKREHWNLPN
mmetsp:Transcript_22209/g.19037  ORF Transcript_22209/g.19037 Transcript_22209/m.19037 type:complete len:420 (-) Transcript_22209:169-1428(-)|eukprot:CAMPEP_0114601794 /NCGR_PEP_ID=MMETSP0125-20121206/24407_1 /TAXON_ID=485358 ORGANISM="Aristerostoma sp., Strain ATCC 50986" /NCGR_SAMPLE_ID=MMETSP0125 /ASSEMBLY_ACC=CAM_ASM_000245 /LENGTH=419 /DNA_ID=CAMNT_0001811367 /DNA_START=827 /DNA_END=2086 /DNA_ORIENTATION=-